jgi:hypothetical protein
MTVLDFSVAKRRKNGHLHKEKGKILLIQLKEKNTFRGGPIGFQV